MPTRMKPARCRCLVEKERLADEYEAESVSYR